MTQCEHKASVGFKCGTPPNAGKQAAAPMCRPVLVVEYEFEKKGEYTVACSVQDDQGGEQTVIMTLNAT